MIFRRRAIIIGKVGLVMNKYDELFEFRTARTDEIDRIMEFICNYWDKPNHILATDRCFFEYEYFYEGQTNIYLAVERNTGNIAAMLCLYFYEKNYEIGRSDMSTGMFLANPTCKVPFVGIELHKRVLEHYNPRAYIAPGVNKKTSEQLLKKFLHSRVERMRQFYIPGKLFGNHIAMSAGASQRTYEFLGLQKKIISYDNVYEMYDNFNEADYKERKPYKDRWYIEKRYFKHPIYKYLMLGIEDKAVLVCREIQVDYAKILRIVDILGDPRQICTVGQALKELIDKNNYEYIDLYEQNMEENDLYSAGFIERTEHDSNIVPNYFEPFIKENIEIWVHRRDYETLCFKADGDQDRPNHR